MGRLDNKVIIVLNPVNEGSKYKAYFKNDSDSTVEGNSAHEALGALLWYEYTMKVHRGFTEIYVE